MTVQTVTLNIPEMLYHRIKQRADQTDRTVEDEVLELVATAMPVSDELPTDLAEAIAPLALLNDTALWEVGRTRFPSEAADELETLHFKRQREGLTEAETARADDLVRQYERIMLVRAQAMLLLKQRGYDISELVQQV